VARCSRKQLAEKAKIGDFRIWLIESGRAVASHSEEIELRRALHQLIKERSLRFYTLLEETNQT
jgi:hypothetical protein